MLKAFQHALDCIVVARMYRTEIENDLLIADPPDDWRLSLAERLQQLRGTKFCVHQDDGGALEFRARCAASAKDALDAHDLGVQLTRLQDLDDRPAAVFNLLHRRAEHAHQRDRIGRASQVFKERRLQCINDILQIEWISNGYCRRGPGSMSISAQGKAGLPRRGGKILNVPGNLLRTH